MTIVCAKVTQKLSTGNTNTHSYRTYYDAADRHVKDNSTAYTQILRRDRIHLLASRNVL